MSIILTHLRKSFGTQTVVDDLSLQIESGELFVLLGASGSGKSTLLRMIAGLAPLDAGQIWLNDRNVTGLVPQERGTGFVFQNYSLFRHMTVEQNIDFGLGIRRVPAAERRRRVQELLRLIHLEGYESRLPNQLSGGQQQRVALARALAYEPTVLLLDEPFGALDVKIRVQLRQNLREIQRALGVTTILVTHDQEEAFELSDRIGIIHHGKLVEVGTPSVLYRRPRTHFTATFLGDANLLPARRNGTHVYLGTIALPVPEATDALRNQPVDLLVRPEEVELAPTDGALSGTPIARGIVRSVSFAGPLERVNVELTPPVDGVRFVDALLTPHGAERNLLEPQAEVSVGIRSFHLLPRADVPAAV